MYGGGFEGGVVAGGRWFGCWADVTRSIEDGGVDAGKEGYFVGEVGSKVRLGLQLAVEEEEAHEMLVRCRSCML